jgi:hypothetical protein
MFMKKFILVLVLSFIPTLVHAQASDICKNSANLRNVSISINSATTTRLVDNSTSPNRYIVICGLNLTIIGAATPQTLSFISGTGATCGTGTTTLTPAMSGPGAATDTAFWVIPPFSFGKIKNGDSLCVTTTTVQQISGALNFVFVGPA